MIYVNDSLIQSPTTRGINYTTYCLQEMNKATACDIREHIIYHAHAQTNKSSIKGNSFASNNSYAFFFLSNHS